MRTALLSAARSLLFATSLHTSLHAQNNITSRQVGDITYFGGTLHGEAVTGSARQIGDTIFYNLTVGGRRVNYAKLVVGPPSSTQGSDGTSSASREVSEESCVQHVSAASSTLAARMAA
jgi:hypothetical protein